MAFEPGKSGNPGGRPKKLLPDGRSLTDLCRIHTDIAVQALSDILRDDGTPPAARIQAANALLDRGWGRPAQSVELTGDISATVKRATDMEDDELAAIAAGRSAGASTAA